MEEAANILQWVQFSADEETRPSGEESQGLVGCSGGWDRIARWLGMVILKHLRSIAGPKGGVIE